MKWTLAAIALAATASADALVGHISPRDGAVGSCKPSYDGKFEVTIGKLDKRDVEKRSCDNPDALLLTLDGGILKDAKSRIGYIASNYQFQFDGPPQAGALSTSGFSACANGSLALHGSAQFYQCRSGNFYNLYDRHWAAQCEPVEILIMPCSGGNSGGNGGGEVTVGTKVVQTTIVTAIADGQPQVHTTTVAIPICQIGDGQIQGHTTPCGGRSPASPISQISDGQIQGPTKPPVITPTAPGAAKPTGPPITQISDGQPQAPVGTASAPRPPASAPPQIPVNGGSKAIPGTSAALAIALIGILAL
ncbi:covalently-linked cell wall [Trichoderma arundinaceum]|uniref:Covalently-linked cell wall n=1 Tax=Trichoderma arundinaceum TaxID=490622 RepID=A0A395NY96_TRIAR|nr:covalently-linked cell wall [Trichoderma arundinaceum]